MRTILILILGYLILTCSARAAATSHAAYDRFFAALHQVESGGSLNPAKGDSGRALGPFQIWRAYWVDSGVKGSYSRCSELGYSRRVVEQYLKRWAPVAWATGDWETLARVHNGGPRGASKAATVQYWGKVAKEMGKVII